MRKTLRRWVPGWCIIPLASILAVNTVVYSGSGFLTASRFHYDWTTALDRAVPLVPEFVWIYLLAFAFWGVGYLLVAQRGKEQFYRFVATDLSIHLCCFVLFLIWPTTNVRPAIDGNSLSRQMLRVVYRLDGGTAPFNLFPSIHCYVSWLCYRGIAGSKKIPVFYQKFSRIFAILIIISTQVLKQHYLVDAVAAIALAEFWQRFYQKGQRQRPLEHFFETINHKIWKEEQEKTGL